MSLPLFNKDPNFSIVAPGSCNAECSFCFSKGTNHQAVDLGTYIGNLSKTLYNLPEEFYQISITGGEPLLSPYIIQILSTIYPFKMRYSNILLTTNGTNLKELFGTIAMSVDHINISRHHYDQDANLKIFGGTYKFMDSDIEEAINMYSTKGIDISANCVINDSTTKEFIENYIKWARGMGFSAVRFRKENGDLSKTPVECLYADHKITWEGSCPVCRTTQQMIRGFDVYWKSSVLEPSDLISNTVFELVYAHDGNCYMDWQYNRPVIVNPSTNPYGNLFGGSYAYPKAPVSDVGACGKTKARPSSSSCGGSSCGGSSSRC